jgi:hypothetical protein
MHVQRKAVRRGVLVATVTTLLMPFGPWAAHAATTLPGSWSVSPSSVTAGAGPSSYVFRYTTKTAVNNGAASIAIPAAWGTPQITSASQPDFGIAQKGTCTGGHLHVYTVADGYNPPRLAYEGFSCSKANGFVQMSLNNVTAPTLPGPYAFAGYAATTSAGPVVTLLNTVITVNAGPAKKLAFVIATGGSQPGPFSFQAGNTMQSTAVAVQDQFGNPIKNSAALITVTSSPLSGTLAKTPTLGVATFTNLTGTLAGLSYPFVASSPGLTSASSAYNITPGLATHLAFDTQPTNTEVNQTMSPDVVVGIYDVYGNYANNVSFILLNFGNNPRSGGGTATGNPVVNGQETFTGVSLDTAAVGYTFTAAAFGLPTVTSAPFDATLPIARPAADAGTYENGPYGTRGSNLFQWAFWNTADNPYTGGFVSYASGGGMDSTPDAGTSGFVWEQNSSDPRALGCGICFGPSAAAWFGSDFSLTETFTAGATKFTAYLVDWDTTSRAETVTIDDGTGPQPAHVTAFHGGAYVSAPISNTATSVTVHLHSDAGDNAVISGVFLD